MEIFRLLIKTQNFIPELFHKNSTYLNVNNIQNLMICCKFLRRIIEQNSKSKCQRFIDFKEQQKKKFRKYKTWFVSFLLWECKFPIQILRNVRKTISRNENYVNFIPLVPFKLENTEFKIDLETKEIFPSISSVDNRLYFNFCLGSRKAEDLEKRDEKERDWGQFVEESDSFENLRKEFKLESSEFPNLSSAVKFLAIKGFYPVDHEKSFREISESINRNFYEETSYFSDSFCFNDMTGNPFRNHERKFKNFKNRLGYYSKFDSKQQILRKYYSIFGSLDRICHGGGILKDEKYLQEVTNFVSSICKFFEVKSTIPNFIELFNSDKVLFNYYDVGFRSELVIEVNFG